MDHLAWLLAQQSFIENPDVLICSFHVQESLEVCEPCSAIFSFTITCFNTIISTCRDWWDYMTSDSPATIAHITRNSVKLCVSLSVVDCSYALQSKAILQSFNVLHASRNCLYFIKNQLWCFFCAFEVIIYFCWWFFEPDGCFTLIFLGQNYFSSKNKFPSQIFWNISKENTNLATKHFNVVKQLSASAVLRI
jgi:hypothetical protein